MADLGPIKAPGASASPAFSTALAQMSPGLEAQPGPPSRPSQAPASVDLNQLIGVLTRLVQGQVAHVQAQSQPMIMVVPIVIQVPVPYPWPVQVYRYPLLKVSKGEA